MSNLLFILRLLFRVLNIGKMGNIWFRKLNWFNPVSKKLQMVQHTFHEWTSNISTQWCSFSKVILLWIYHRQSMLIQNTLACKHNSSNCCTIKNPNKNLNNIHFFTNVISFIFYRKNRENYPFLIWMHVFDLSKDPVQE